MTRSAQQRRSIRTVANQMQSIYTKLGVNSRTELRPFLDGSAR